MSDGLSALTQQREKAVRSSARTVPPPRHAPKPRSTRPEPQGDPEPDEGAGSARAAPVAPRATPAAAATAARGGGGEVEPLTRATIYLDAHGDAYLEQVNSAGRTSRPKVDGSRSAVVRLALQRLEEQMTPHQVVDELRNRAAASTQHAGRKRL